MDESPSLLTLSVGELLESVAAQSPTPGGGAVAALAAALAGGLTAMAARYSVAKTADPATMSALLSRADELTAVSGPLADADAAAYRAFLAAVRLPREPDPEARRAAVAVATDRAADVPLATVEAAGEIAGLAAVLVRTGNPNLRADAAAAVQLAAAAATTAAIMVGENLRRTPDDPRLARATAVATAAREAATLCVGLFPAVAKGSDS